MSDTFLINGSVATLANAMLELSAVNPVVVFDPITFEFRTHIDGTHVSTAIAAMRAKVTLTNVISTRLPYGHWTLETDGYISGLSPYFAHEYLNYTAKWIFFLVKAQEPALVIICSSPWTIGATDDTAALDGLTSPVIVPVEEKPPKPPRMAFE